MNRYNKLKLRVLSLFASAGDAWLGPGEAAERLNFLPHRSAWTYLKRLWRFGLLEKRSRGRGTLQYRISEQGTARLRWFTFTARLMRRKAYRAGGTCPASPRCNLKPGGHSANQRFEPMLSPILSSFGFVAFWLRGSACSPKWLNAARSVLAASLVRGSA